MRTSFTAGRSVLVDIDDTIAKTQEACIAYARQVSGRAFKKHDIIREFSDNPDDEFEALVRTFIDSKDYERTILAIEPYAVYRSLRDLRAAGWHITVASSREENWHEATVEWLDRNRLLPFVDHLFLRTRDINTLNFKTHVAEMIQPMAMFDDSPMTALGLRSVPRFYLINQPWNQHIEQPSYVIRATDFAAAVRDFLEPT